MTFFFINSKTLWKHIFYDTILIFQQISWINRSTRSQMFFKIGILKNFAIITGKLLYWSLFLIKLQTWRAAALLNRDSNTGVSMWILQNFSGQLSIKYLRWLLLNKVQTNVKSTWFILLPDWLYYVIKSIMILNSKHSAKLQRYRSRNTKKQKHEKLKHRKTKT